MAGNEDTPRLPQRRGRKTPGDLPDGFEPIVPLFRRRKAGPPRPLPRSATAPPRPAAPPTAHPEPQPQPPQVIAEPPSGGKSHSRLLAVFVAVLLVLLVVLAIALLA
ncbi:MAG: hypothetical protein ABIR39_17085 [Nocardioides sp.]|uniref:hypothetical protein n=1 Tax=Nocardioides sp. TaxID=35761 RepID=UPI003263986E